MPTQGWTCRHKGGHADTRVDMPTQGWTCRHKGGHADTRVDMQTQGWTCRHKGGHADTRVDMQTQGWTCRHKGGHADNLDKDGHANTGWTCRHMECRPKGGHADTRVDMQTRVECRHKGGHADTGWTCRHKGGHADTRVDMQTQGCLDMPRLRRMHTHINLSHQTKLAQCSTWFSFVGFSSRGLEIQVWHLQTESCFVILQMSTMYSYMLTPRQCSSAKILAFYPVNSTPSGQALVATQKQYYIN